MTYDCVCDYDPPIFYSAVTRTARASHRCYECGGEIRTGEQYEYTSGKWPDLNGISVFKTCEQCCAIRRWLENNLPCFCWAHGNLYQDAIDSVCDAYDRAPDEVVGLRFGLQRRQHELNKFNKFRSQERGT